MTDIRWWGDGADVCVAVRGHAVSSSGENDADTAARVCATVSVITLTLWTVTGAVGAWKGPEGGEAVLRVSIRHEEALLSAYLAFFALTQWHPDYVSMANDSLWLSERVTRWRQQQALRAGEPGVSPMLESVL